jgi:hypothetical protein
MTYQMIITISLNIILGIPLILTAINRTFLNRLFEIACAYFKQLGFLDSINGVIRVGKTSLQSGLKHIGELEIIDQLESMILKTKQVYSHIDFRDLDQLLEQRFTNIWPGYFVIDVEYQLEFDILTQDIIKWFEVHENMNLSTSIIYNFTSSKTSQKYIEDYVMAYFCLNFRKNFVMSKTPFYSHITGTFSYQLNPENFKINDAYKLQNYAIYDFMIILVDEYSDDYAASARYDDMKETSGVKDYLRKFGQIHQERNKLITTKQDVKDEMKKLRNLTQSNLWIPTKVEQRGISRLLLKVITFFYTFYFFFYDLTIVRYRMVKFNLEQKKMGLDPYDFDDYLEHDYKRVNLKRHVEHRLLHIDWFLFSIGFNKYEVWNYSSEEDVKKRDPQYYQKMMFYIPIQFCFGTYDTHYWRMIQKEQLLNTQEVSNESNWFEEVKYFESVEEKGGETDVADF